MPVRRQIWIERLIRQPVLDAIAATGGNIVHAAGRLECPVRSLRLWINRMGLQSEIDEIRRVDRELRRVIDDGAE